MIVRSTAPPGDRTEDRNPSSRRPAVAVLPWGDRFEDFHDELGLSLEEYCERYTGTWIFNCVDALKTAGIRSVLYFVSARVPRTIRMTHRATGALVCAIPAPWVHRKLQGARDRLRIDSSLFASALSYAATPWISLLRELRRDGCDAILCHEYENPRFDQAIAVGRRVRLPVFATFQGRHRPGSCLELPFRRHAVRRAAGLVIGARREADRVRRTYGIADDRIALLPNAFDTGRWYAHDRDAAREAVGLPRGACVVVWHGRVEVDTKGLDVLLDAWMRVAAQRGPAAPLLMLIGSGRDDADVRRRLGTMPPGTVRWESRYILDRSRLWQFLSAADIAALPSRREGFPVTVIESMACRLPVVAADVSGVREALGDEPTGLIVPRENPRALADALVRLMHDERLRRDLGARARQRAEREFSLDTVGRRLRAFMEARGAFGTPPRPAGT